MTEISDGLRAALTEWLEWSESGAPDGHPFFRSFGLCKNIDQLQRGRAIELSHLFFGNDYPFGGSDYFYRAINRTQHECPKRLAWVRKTLGVEQ